MSQENQSLDDNPRLPYEAPRILEDLPLETYSLACDPAAGGKNPGVCDVAGFANT